MSAIRRDRTVAARDASWNFSAAGARDQPTTSLWIVRSIAGPATSEISPSSCSSSASESFDRSKAAKMLVCRPLSGLTVASIENGRCRACASRWWGFGVRFNCLGRDCPRQSPHIGNNSPSGTSARVSSVVIDHPTPCAVINRQSPISVHTVGYMDMKLQ